MARRLPRCLALLIGVTLLWLAPWSVREARADGDLRTELAAVVGSDSEAARVALERLKARADTRALSALSALDDGSLRVDATGALFIAGPGGLSPALPDGPRSASGALSTPSVDNALRRLLLP